MQILQILQILYYKMSASILFIYVAGLLDSAAIPKSLQCKVYILDSNN